MPAFFLQRLLLGQFRPVSPLSFHLQPSDLKYIMILNDNVAVFSNIPYRIKRKYLSPNNLQYSK